MNEDIEADVISLVRDAARVGDVPIDLDTSLEQLGIESLDMVELLFAIEDRFGIDVPYNANAVGESGLAKVRDVVTAIRQLISQRTAQA
ncbi:MAG: acyl carrier protein [Sphingomonas sp.]|uniref:acyl carrier protein n=1 Tax=unclassified Sphingomonas TaxID=196159 RepID=UPI00245824AD|nr:MULTISPECIES: acyl carrier protein [unclassified Sphingomonas]MBQ1497038.1 acyl carrier protein [Sphingomonas sp.]MDH4744019.1 acyl carrier protein [Sphingomonas sp. CBMAI 2297]